MKTVLVTGASGFVGQHLCAHLSRREFDVIGTIRRQSHASASLPYRLLALENLNARGALLDIFQDVDTVVHLAARVHMMKDVETDPMSLYLEENLRTTETVALCAADAGVRRLVFLSTVKVLGDVTERLPFSDSTEPDPSGPYAISKLRAEESLDRISEQTGIEIVVVRPPLVYGPRVGGNFLRMLRLVAKGIPLPLGAVSNRRSMISVANLCDAIECCIDSPAISGRKFLVSDNEDVSTPDLLRMLAKSMGKRARLVRVPVGLLRQCARVSGRGAEISRLCDSLQVDISSTCEWLSWSPRVSLQDGLDSVVEWFVRRETRRDG